MEQEVTSNPLATEQTGTDVLDTLIRQPLKNLESRIAMLEFELDCLTAMHNATLTRLGSLRVQAESRLRKARYLELSLPVHVSALRDQLHTLVRNEDDEARQNFRDAIALKQETQAAKEELSIARSRLKVITYTELKFQDSEYDSLG